MTRSIARPLCDSRAACLYVERSEAIVHVQRALRSLNERVKDDERGQYSRTYYPPRDKTT